MKSNAVITQRIYSARQIAAWFGVTKGCVHNWVFRNQIPFFRRNRKCYFDIKEIEAWIGDLKCRRDALDARWRNKRCAYCRGTVAEVKGWRYGPYCDACRHRFYKYNRDPKIGNLATTLRHLKKRIEKINGGKKKCQ